MRWNTTEITSLKLNLKIINTQKQALINKCKPRFSLLVVQQFNSYTFLCFAVWYINAPNVNQLIIHKNIIKVIRPYALQPILYLLSNC